MGSDIWNSVGICCCMMPTWDRVKVRVRVRVRGSVRGRVEGIIC